MNYCPLKRFQSVVLAVLAAFTLCDEVSAQIPLDLGVTVASVSPPQLNLVWSLNSWQTTTITSSQVLYRRVYGATSWGTPIATLAVTANSYSDTTLTAGVEYEYRLQQDFNSAVNFTSNSATGTAGSSNGGQSYYQVSTGNLHAFGYICASINLPYKDSRGTLLLLVDNTMSTPLATELAQLQQDLAGDGWNVVRTDLARQTVNPATTGTAVGAARLAEVQSVKNVIKNAYTADPTHVKAVYLLGHLPVPYSGNNNPDAHPEHKGAWPADAYYGDMTGNWTDTTVNNTSADDYRNDNIPGDGKFDQSGLPNSTLQVQVGRVDLANMTQAPNSTVTETQLLQRYLRRAHQYRFRQGAYANIQRRGLAQEWWGQGAPESLQLGTNAILGRNLAGTSNMDYLGHVGGNDFAITWGTWMINHPTLNYLFGYCQGAGGFTSAQGGGYTQDWGTKPTRAVFTSLFGSYFGDWDYLNGFLKAPLTGNAMGDALGLACFWSGRPLWLIHPMAMGGTLGEITRLSQSYTAASYPNLTSFYEGYVHTALMGDPALRLYSVQPPQNVTAQSSSGGVTLSWSTSTESNVLGYQVYRSTVATGPFTSLTPSPVTALTFTDSTGTTGTIYTYLVKTLKLESQNGGTFQNPSAGTPVTVTVNSSATSVPSAPTGLQAVASTSTQINLSWSASTGSPAGYLVQRATGSSGSFSTIATLGNVTSYMDVGPLAGGTTFYYQIVATKAVGNSAPSEKAYVDGANGFLQMGSSILYPTVTTASGNGVDITVLRQGGDIGAVGVTYTTVDGSAKAGTHYTATTGTLAWADGDTGTKTIHVALAASPQEPGTFYVRLGSATGGASVYAPTQCVVLIEDPSLPVKLPWVTTILNGPTTGDPGYVTQLSSGEIADTVYSSYAYKNFLGRYTYQPISGDQMMTVHCEATSPTVSEQIKNPGQIGIEVHTSANLSAYDKFAAIEMTDGTTGVHLVGNTLGLYNNPAEMTPASGANTQSGACWLRMIRAGNNFTGLRSVDGVTWITVGTITMTGTFPTSGYWGLWHQSSYPGDYQQARFNNISFAPLTAPATPTSLTAVNPTTGGILLNWGTDNYASGYNVYRRNAGTSTFTLLATTTGNTYTDTTATSGTVYEFEVNAFNNEGTSAYSTIAFGAIDVTSGLIGRWKFDSDTTDTSSGGTVADNGTLVGTGGSYVTGTNAAVGTAALSLDGTGSYVSVPTSTDINLTTGCTFSVWVKLASATDNSYRMLISKKITYTDTTGYEFFYHPVLHQLLLRSGGNTSYSLSLPLTLDTNWHHLAVTINGGTAVFYLDGAVKTGATGTVANPTSGTQTLTIGRRSGTTDYPWNGRLDDVRIYNRPLTAGEVASVYYQEQ